MITKIFLKKIIRLFYRNTFYNKKKIPVNGRVIADQLYKRRAIELIWNEMLSIYCFFFVCNAVWLPVDLLQNLKHLFLFSKHTCSLWHYFFNFFFFLLSFSFDFWFFTFFSYNKISNNLIILHDHIPAENYVTAACMHFKQ